MSYKYSFLTHVTYVPFLLQTAVESKNTCLNSTYCLWKYHEPCCYSWIWHCIKAWFTGRLWWKKPYHMELNQPLIVYELQMWCSNGYCSYYNFGHIYSVFQYNKRINQQCTLYHFIFLLLFNMFRFYSTTNKQLITDFYQLTR